MICNSCRRIALVLGASAFLGGGAACAGEAGALRWTGTLEAYGDAFFDDPAQTVKQRDDVVVWSRLSLEASYTPDPSVSFDLGGYAAGSAPDLMARTWGEAFQTDEAANFDLTLANVHWRGTGFDLVVGKAPLKLGYGDLYSPANRFEPHDYANPLHDFPMGLWQATASLYLGDDRLSLSVLPADERPRRGDDESRWSTGAGNTPFFDLSALPSSLAIPGPVDLRFGTSFRSLEPEDWGALLTYTGRRQAFDFYLGAHVGAAAYPVLRGRAILAPLVPGAATTIVANQELLDTVSALGGIVIARERYKLYADAIWQHTPAGEDDDFLRYLLGAQVQLTPLARWLAVEEARITIEYAGDVRTDKADTTDPILVSRFGRPYANYALWELRLVVDRWLQLYGKGAANVYDGDTAGLMGFDYLLTDELTVKGALYLFAGDPDTQFGLWRDNDGAYLGLELRF
jgi:hypothetical protein